MNSLGVTRARHRQVGRPLPILDRSISQPGLCEVVRDKFGLDIYDLWKMGLVRSCDPSMQLLAVGPKQTGICNILHQRMFEGILRIRRLTVPEDQLSANKLLEPIVQLALWYFRHSVQQLVRELAAQCGTDLGHLSHRSQSVKPCHQ